jgi:phospholipase C
MIMHVLATLVANPAIWERTALIVSYDENGGFFDHVSPPTPPPGTPGEYVLRPSGDPSTSPIGLGFRVPCLVISPYSRGGHVNSETFDHTSQLRLLGRRFGVDVPYLSPWRRRVAGDMTHLLDASNVSAAHLTIPTHTSAERLSAASLAKRSFELKEDR